MRYTIETALRPGFTIRVRCNDWEAEAAIAQLDKLVGVSSQPTAAPTTTSPAEPLPDFPEKILAYAKSWNEPWVETDALERAKRLWTEHKNWELVYAGLLEQDGEKDLG